ncbi:acetoacetyl-CoA reductase [Deltaproteobacteria bacterium]|nr:acetoacetyl-CoA reductase [Deltaproteobacteria bacterium]
MQKQNRVAFITGASRGLGLAMVKAFLNAGNKVALIDVLPFDINEIPEEQRKSVMFSSIDVKDIESCISFIQNVKDIFGPIGILVNNAGISPKMPSGVSANLLELTMEEWEKVIAVNLTSAIFITKAILPQMLEMGWGRIINMHSQAGRARISITGPSYNCSKGALGAFTRTLASEWGPRGVTANSIAPGRITSPMVEQLGAEKNKAMVQTIPVRRYGTAEEVAAVAVFLAAESSGFLNGIVVDINGGAYMPA